MKIKLNLFFRSFFLSFVIFALVSGIIITSLYLDIVSVEPTSKESNVLIGVTHDGQLLSLAVINFDPREKRISFLPIPDNTLISNSKILQSLYKKDHISELRSVTEGLIGTKIDRYILFNADAILSLNDYVGRFEYLIPYKFSYNGAEYSGQCNMRGELAKAMFTYEGYDMTKVSLSEMGKSYMHSFLTMHATASSAPKIASGLCSDSIAKNIETNLTQEEIEEYCELLAKYSSFSHKLIELDGKSYATSSSTYFTPTALNSTENIFK